MNASNHINVLVLSIYQDLAETFIESLSGGQTADILFGDQNVHFDLVAGDPDQYPNWQELSSHANAFIFIVRFLDVLSLDKIKNIYRCLPDNRNMPVGIFLLRDKSEIDFKISCPSCGQKLWLRDTDVGKRGRCPNCKKPFFILSQVDHIKTQLMLPDAVIIRKVIRDDTESCQNSLVKLMEGMTDGIRPVDSASEDATKNATMRIQIQES